MNKFMVLFVCMVFGMGCATSSKERKEARDHAAIQSGLFCDFVNESDYRDVEVELNIRMANKCNGSKPFSISGYKRLNESAGFMYCCSVKDAAASSVKESSAVDNQKATPAVGKNDSDGEGKAVESKTKETSTQGK